MPDENTNPTGGTQTLQNSQAVTNQSGDDFVLDFGEGKSENETKSLSKSLDNIIEGNGENMSIDVKNSDLEYKFSEEKDDVIQNGLSVDINDVEKEITAPKEQEESKNNEEEKEDDFGFSFDFTENDSSNNEENNIDILGTSTLTNNEEILDLNQRTINDNSSEELLENYNQESLNDPLSNEEHIRNDMEFGIDDNTGVDDEKQDINIDNIDNEENFKLNDTGEIQIEPEADDKVLNNLNESNDLIEDPEIKEGNSEIKDTLGVDKKDNEDTFLDSGLFNDVENKGIIDNKVDSTAELNVDDGSGNIYFNNSFSESLNDSSEAVGLEDNLKLDGEILNQNNSEVINKENFESGNINEKPKESDFVDPEEKIQQPDISSLLGDKNVDFSIDETSIDIKNDNNIDNDSGDNRQDTEIHITMEQNLSEKAPEKKDAVMSKEGDDNNQINQIDVQPGKDNVLNQEIQNQEKEKIETNEISNINKDQLNGNSEKEINVQKTSSTLSLDQILDSELLSNPQYSDDSKAVPKNVPIHSGFFGNKKSIIISAGILVLIGCVVVFAFPLNSSDIKEGDVVPSNDENQIENYHNITEMLDSEMQDITEETLDISTEIDENIEASIPGDNEGTYGSPKTTTEIEMILDETIGDDMGDMEEKLDQCIDSDNCEDGDTENHMEEIEEISIEMINENISYFSEQAKGYEKIGEDLGNTRIIKYAGYLAYLCDQYQKKINSGEGLDYESFSSFKAEAGKTWDKIENEVNSDDEVFEFTPPLQNSSDFEGKDEIIDFILNG